VYHYHYPNIAKGRVNLVSASFDSENFKFKFDMKNVKSKISSKTKVILLCNPNNPTGQIFTKEDYSELTELLRDYPNIVVIEDAAYFAYRNNIDIHFFHEFD
jgi:aspartate/methionine/tyrosine aminotransferase